MLETPEQLDAMFPALDDAQIARLRPFGEELHVRPGEMLFDQGDATRGVFIVLEGSIEIVGVPVGEEAVVRVLGRGVFTGEVSQLSARRTMVRCLAREATTVLRVHSANLL